MNHYWNVLHHSQFIEWFLDYWFRNYSRPSIKKPKKTQQFCTLCVYYGIFVSLSVPQRTNMTSVGMANMHIVLTDSSMEGQSGKKSFCFYLNVLSHSTEELWLASAQWHDSFFPRVTVNKLFPSMSVSLLSECSNAGSKDTVIIVIQSFYQTTDCQWQYRCLCPRSRGVHPAVSFHSSLQRQTNLISQKHKLIPATNGFL